MLQLIAAIPTIFSAINRVTDLFNKGKESVRGVSGKISEASTPEELRTEIEKLPDDQKNRWAEIMANEVDIYTKQNERLAIEIGLIDPNITSNLSTKTANKIAKLRMTTRPWTVRLMVHYVLFPFYLVIVDLIQNILITWLPFLKSIFAIKPFNAFEYVFGVLELPGNPDASTIQKLFEVFSEKGIVPATLAGEFYIHSIPFVVSIIIGYMGLREIGKARGHKDAEAPTIGYTPSPVSVASMGLSSGVSLIGNIRQWFKT